MARSIARASGGNLSSGSGGPKPPPPPLRIIRQSERFRTIGKAPGSHCMHCHSADGEVLRIRDRWQTGSKPEPLHPECAPAWFR